MILKMIFIFIFLVLFIYALVRPFSSMAAKYLVILGSILGILSLIGETYTGIIANFFGISRAVDLYLYLSLITIFLFISYTINRLDIINKRISELTKGIAINNARRDGD